MARAARENLCGAATPWSSRSLCLSSAAICIPVASALLAADEEDAADQRNVADPIVTSEGLSRSKQSSAAPRSLPAALLIQVSASTVRA